MADYWMKLYIEILDDPKMATMPDRAWRRTIEIFLVAKKINKDGHLPDTRQIAWLLRMSADELEHDLIQIASTGIIVQEVGGWFIPKFAQRQAAVPDAERKAQERVRKQSQQYYGDVTNQSRNVTQRTEDRLTEADTETEINNNGSDLSKMSAFVANLCKVQEFSGGTEAWYGGLKALKSMGATEQDITHGFLALKSNKRKNYTVVGPQSLITAVSNVMQLKAVNAPHEKELIKVDFGDGIEERTV
jgi:hypothetical protein